MSTKYPFIFLSGFDSEIDILRTCQLLRAERSGMVQTEVHNQNAFSLYTEYLLSGSISSGSSTHFSNFFIDASEVSQKVSESIYILLKFIY